MVGPGHNDHRRLRRHGPQNLHRHVRGRPLRPGRRTNHRTASARHRQQLRHVLLAHAGQGQTAKEAETSASRRAAAPAQTAR